MALDRGQQRGETARTLDRLGEERGDGGARRIAVTLRAGEVGEAQQRVGGDRVAGRQGAVVTAAGPDGELLVVVGGGVEAASRGGEVGFQNVRDLLRRPEPVFVEIALEEIEERLEPEGVIVEHRRHLRLPAAPHREVAAVCAEVVEEKPARALRHAEMVLVAERSMRPRERRHRERVPGEEDLVVEPGPHPLAAPGKQPLSRGGEFGLDPAGRHAESLLERGISQHPPQDRPALPVPLLPNVVGGAEERGVLPEDFPDLRG